VGYNPFLDQMNKNKYEYEYILYFRHMHPPLVFNRLLLSECYAAQAGKKLITFERIRCCHPEIGNHHGRYRENVNTCRAAPVLH